MRYSSAALLLAALPIVLGQTATTSIPPPPTESVGCTLHGDHYHCEGPASVSTGLPSHPIESEGCTLHGDHYHCEEEHEGHEDEHTPTATSQAEAVAPSPTESAYCMLHETHWDCFDSQTELAEAQGADESGECVIHVGHTHGDCSAEDLACGRVLLDNFNMPLHIAAIFIVLVSSGLGVMIPLISSWFRKTPNDGDSNSAVPLHQNSAADFGKSKGVWANVFFIARHFGTGIIISTAFIHLLFHGFVMFQNECVGHLTYESTAPAIAMAAAMVTFLFDFFGSRVAQRAAGQVGCERETDDAVEKNLRSRDSPVTEEGDDGHGGAHHHHHHHHIDAVFAAEQNWQVMLLEAGIIFHSIMIGVTLGAGSGNGWTTLLIVIVFHQFFEGLALGARIAVLTWITKLRALLMGAAFMLITPIGIAIGIAVRESFSQNGKASLLSVGILNSISAGILLYTAFKLLSADFTDGPLRTARPFKVFVALASLVVGLIAMSVLGKWA